MPRAKGTKPTSKKQGLTIDGGTASQMDAGKVPKDIPDIVDVPLPDMLPGIAALYGWFVRCSEEGRFAWARATVMLVTQEWDPNMPLGTRIKETTSFGQGTIAMTSPKTIRGTIAALRNLSVDWPHPAGVAFSKKDEVDLLVHPLTNKVVLGSDVVTEIVSSAPFAGPYPYDPLLKCGAILCGRLVPKKKSPATSVAAALTDRWLVLSFVHFAGPRP